jgi:hypothetical protein
MNDILDDLNSWLDLLVVERRYRQQVARSQAQGGALSPRQRFGDTYLAGVICRIRQKSLNRVGDSSVYRTVLLIFRCPR